MWHRLQAVSGQLTIVAITTTAGFTEHTLIVVRSLVEASRPDFTQYIAPSSLVACFKPKSAARANSLIASTRELRSQEEFSDISAATADGVVIYQSDWLGRIRTLPLGTVVNRAILGAASGMDAK